MSEIADPVVLFEDDHLLVVDKPAGLLSQPGRTVNDSVHTRMLALRHDLAGPVIVHRLDMDTSGIMLLARHREAHRHLQQQFEHRRVMKTYVAIVSGRVESLGGCINLPLRLNLDNRPQQIVCHSHGKSAQTTWHRLVAGPHYTRLQLYPHTGRTHQLRVHMAHPHGLGLPIVGDRLYGEPATRMLLHANRIQFTHPHSGARQTIESHIPF